MEFSNFCIFKILILYLIFPSYYLFDVSYSPNFFIVENNKINTIQIEYNIDEESKIFLKDEKEEKINNKNCVDKENSIICSYDVELNEENKEYYVGYGDSFDKAEFDNEYISIHPLLSNIEQCQNLEDLNIELTINNNLRENLTLYLNNKKFNSSPEKNPSTFIFNDNTLLSVGEYPIMANLNEKDENKYNISNNFTISIYKERQYNFNDKKLYTQDNQKLEIDFDEDISKDDIDSVTLQSKTSNKNIIKSNECEVDSHKILKCFFDLSSSTIGEYDVYYNAKCISNKKLSMDNTYLIIEHGDLNVTITSLENNWVKPIRTENQRITINYENTSNNEQSIDGVILVLNNKEYKIYNNLTHLEIGKIQFNISSDDELEENTYSIILTCENNRSESSSGDNMIYIYSEPNFTLNKLYYIKSNNQNITIKSESKIDMIKGIYLNDTLNNTLPFNQNNSEFTLNVNELLSKGEYKPYFIIKGDSTKTKNNITLNDNEIEIYIYENENELYKIDINDCNYYNDNKFSVKFELINTNFPIDDMKIFLYTKENESINLILNQNTTYEYIYSDEEDLNILKNEIVELIISENEDINYYISKRPISFTDFNYDTDLKYLYNTDKLSISNLICNLSTANIIFKNEQSQTTNLIFDSYDDNNKTAYYKFNLTDDDIYGSGNLIIYNNSLRYKKCHI